MKSLILNKDSNTNWFGGRVKTGSTIKVFEKQAEFHSFELLVITVITDHPIRYCGPIELDPDEVRSLMYNKAFTRNIFTKPYGFKKLINLQSINVSSDCTGEVSCTINIDLEEGDMVRLPMFGSGEVINIVKERYFCQVEIELDRYIENVCQWKQ